MKKDKEYIVNGFLFKTEREAKLAEKEIEGIQYVKSRVDLKNPDTVLQLYCKVLEQGLFKTPVGLSFMKEMQEYLEEQPFIKKDDIPPIPIEQEVVIEETIVKKQGNKKEQINKIHEINYKAKYSYSVVFNILLVILVAFMFVIVNTSGNVNILNYENYLIDKYEAWEQELTEREQAIQEKEQALEAN